MGRQIRFFLCSTMQTAVESEAHRIGATLVSSAPDDGVAIQFSTSSGTDTHQGRLWTETTDPAHFNLLCRAVKRGAVYDRDTGLWVKRTSEPAFETYREEKQRALSELVARNRKRYIEEFDGRTPNNEG